jgi:hypothetical protein
VRNEAERKGRREGGREGWVSGVKNCNPVTRGTKVIWNVLCVY